MSFVTDNNKLRVWKKTKIQTSIDKQANAKAMIAKVFTAGA